MQHSRVQLRYSKRIIRRKLKTSAVKTAERVVGSGIVVTFFDEAGLLKWKSRLLLYCTFEFRMAGRETNNSARHTLAIFERERPPNTR